ncbi:hypothetical protein BDZ89DRAFT_254267 [Hymenopellis radicata]|nr:hypothetical protein BDZ89DRAFT_254267 [Hymenopellis radicata]
MVFPLPISLALLFNPTTQFVADEINVWVHGFWAVSLTAILARRACSQQWVHHYVSLPSGTPSRRSHVRHFRFTGLD